MAVLYSQYTSGLQFTAGTIAGSSTGVSGLNPIVDRLNSISPNNGEISGTDLSLVGGSLIMRSTTGNSIISGTDLQIYANAMGGNLYIPLGAPNTISGTALTLYASDGILSGTNLDVYSSGGRVGPLVKYYAHTFSVGSNVNQGQDWVHGEASAPTYLQVTPMLMGTDIGGPVFGSNVYWILRKADATQIAGFISNTSTSTQTGSMFYMGVWP